MRSLIFTVLSVVIVLVVIGSSLLSPVFLHYIASQLDFNFQRVSELGQSYGAISALLSAVALCILSASTVIQLRQTKIGQLNAARTFQLELLRMALDNPEYREALGVDLHNLNIKEWRSHAYLNLWIMYIQMNFITGTIDEQGARRFLSGEFFNGPLGLEFWRRAHVAFASEASSRQERKFLHIVNDEHQKAVKREACSGCA